MDSFTYLRKSVTWGSVENSEGIPISYRRHPDGTPNQRNNLFLTKKAVQLYAARLLEY